MNYEGWNSFKKGVWQKAINVRDFIVKNYKPYAGGEEFLSPPTKRTQKFLAKYAALAAEEKKRGGVLDIDTEKVSSLLTYPAGYLDKENELVVGIQTGEPLKRGVNPFGGIRMAEEACDAYGYKMGENIREYFRYRTTHNDGVFRVYTPEMKSARHSGVITGLPDAYGRGRIIGDYRRLALYGADFLIAAKNTDMEELGRRPMSEENVRLREEVFRQIDFLKQLKQMAALYGHDISEPAKSFREAVQWVYFAYLGAIKEQNGAAMSLGRVSTFLDIYAERDIKIGVIESEIQEIIDGFVIKLRMARQLRTPEYDELFAGDPTWVTECVGGMCLDGRTMVTKTSFRFLHTLYNLKPSPEPNLTVLWAAGLPEKFKRYCARVSIETCSIQYENDDLMRPLYTDDYGIACCVSAMTIGKQTQLFGARCNIPKVLLLALNGGRDELNGAQIAPKGRVFEGVLDYKEVKKAFRKYLEWLAELYVNTMNVIHYMHDKYAYEKLEMALHDTDAERLMAFGAAGISVAADSLSAIKYARVTAKADERGIISGFDIDGDFPKYGNDDDRADSLAAETAEYFYKALRRTPAYRNAVHTLSLLTITSNVVYGKKTGATPDGRPSGAPFAPGANPMHGREIAGALASLNSVSKINYDCCRDGISNTFSITPASLGADPRERSANLTDILDGYFSRGAHHLNVNVISRKQLLDAQENPANYPNLTIRVSGYAVNFNSLKKESRDEVIKRTFH